MPGQLISAGGGSPERSESKLKSRGQNFEGNVPQNDSLRPPELSCHLGESSSRGSQLPYTKNPLKTYLFCYRCGIAPMGQITLVLILDVLLKLFGISAAINA